MKSKYIDRDYPEISSPAMNQGKFFEFLVGGYYRKGEEPPQAEYYKRSGEGFVAGDLKPEYHRAAFHAGMFKRVLTQFINPAFGVELKFGKVEGIADVIADDVIIDLKYSDLLYDRWSEYGWGKEKFEYAAKMLETDDLLSVLKKVNLLWQPLTYTWLWFKMVGTYPKWYWYIASPKSDDVIFRELVISPGVHATFNALIPQIIAEVELILNTGGFTPRPDYNTCNKCLICESCEMKVDLPSIETITI
jgi:hypothetical protein